MAVAPEAAPKDDAGIEADTAYLIAYSKGRRVARLHKPGGCHHARSLNFVTWEAVALDPVPPEMYTDVCKHCWAQGELPGVSSSEDGSSSSASSYFGSSDRD